MKNYDHKKIEKKWPASANLRTGKQKEYNHTKIEKKWQREWDKKKTYSVKNGSKGKAFFGLIEFPYPSGAGLHVGHIRSNTAMDIITRKRRMEGYNVLYPIGWDAFGLPTENYAIKTGIQPEKVTKQNTDTFRKQLKSVGFGFDWDREINTTDPAYFKWTQWIFLQLYKKGLAYKTKTLINWCINCKIGLANEEVVNGHCERCGGETTKKEKEQWMLAITKYADRLDSDLDGVDYLEKIKIQQRNWIGKSIGSEIEFKIKDSDDKIKVFTTRADTLFGVTYVVLAPEHELVEKLKSNIKNWNNVEKYLKSVNKRSEIDRTAEDKDKTGIVLEGVKAINPVNGEAVPVWIADYVLASYGTGAVMAVPAHDDRDFEFAKKYNLEIRQVVAPLFVTNEGESAVRKNQPFVKRDTIVSIVKHWSEDKYLCLMWKTQSWKTFVIGGTDGEEPHIAGSREIKEETGYQNMKFIKTLGKAHSQFYAPHKKENRWATVVGAYFELIDGEKKETDEHEKSLHDLVWLDKKEVEKIIDKEEAVIFWNTMLGKNQAITDEGILVNSGKFNDLTSDEAKNKITKEVSGKIVTKFKLRDWVFSRQRYWGEPIPIIHCEKCALTDPDGQGYVPVPEKDLPVTLPKVKSYIPTDNGESPLAIMDKWVNVKCPICKGPAKRETDTMPNWAGSSWYYLRYADPKNKKEFASKKALNYWLKNVVSWYNGGMEHTTLHLLYSRFWHKFLYDLKLVPTLEPYAKRTSHGMILAEGGSKMSKSLGNTVSPEEIINNYGADTLRLYEMFMGPFDQAVSWSMESLIGPRRFIEKVWKMQDIVLNRKNKTDSNLEKVLHKTIKKVGEDIESMSFNTAVSSLMVFVNEFEKTKNLSVNDFKKLLQILAPFAPHVTEEMWHDTGEKKSIHKSPWPKFDSKKIVDEEVKIIIQVNGKVRAEILIPKDTNEVEVKKQALNNETIISWTKEKEVKRVIYVKDRLINIVV